MNYQNQILKLIKVNKKDEILGSIERWSAHQEAILHRGFTAIIKINNNIVIQKRKHKVFNNVFDLSFSSHPIFIKKNAESTEEAVKKNLKREWVFKGKILDLKFLDKYYYKEKDEVSGFWEHEINYLFLVNLKGKIEHNPDFAYGMDTLTIENLLKKFKQFNFAPWVKKIPLKKIEKYLSYSV